MSSEASPDWISGAEIRKRTGWNAQQLRRRIAQGKFPAKIDVDRWNRAAVDSHLRGNVTTNNGGWQVNEKAIHLALDGIVRRAKKSATRGRERGNVARPVRGSQAPASSRLASHNRAASG